MKLITCVILFLVLSLNLNACSYTTSTTSGYILHSDLIVNALVEDKKPHPSDPEKVIVYLKAINKLKGLINKNYVEVTVNLKVKCPGPANYTIGSQVITFLKYHDSTGELYTLGHIHGVNLISDSTHSAEFEHLIKSRLKVQEISNRKKRTKKMIEWSINYLEHPIFNHVTREEFSPRGFYYDYDEKENKYQMTKYSRLKNQQKDKIRNYLLTKESLEWNDNVLIEVASKGKDQEMIQLALYHLNKFKRSKGIWYKEFNLMRTITKLSKRDDLESILSKIRKLSIYSRDVELVSLTEQFIAKV